MAFQGLLLLEYVVVLKRTEMFVLVGLYARSPRICLASSMSFSMMVTRLV